MNAAFRRRLGPIKTPQINLQRSDIIGAKHPGMLFEKPVHRTSPPPQAGARTNVVAQSSMKTTADLSRRARNQSARHALPLVGGMQTLTKGGRPMSDGRRSKRSGSAMRCPRCGTEMDEVVSIAPVISEPGLIGYECPNCVYVTSVLVQPQGGGPHSPRRNAA